MDDGIEARYQDPEAVMQRRLHFYVSLQGLLSCVDFNLLSVFERACSTRGFLDIEMKGQCVQRMASLISPLHHIASMCAHNTTSRIVCTKY